ncbi:histidine kinase [Clostridia bacterium]|nr:histidine kinase [Clostridia bacterium]
MSDFTAEKEDSIVLSLPINPAYVSAARLTASSIANRIGFDIDEIEDVKAAVSEACTYIIKNAPNNNQEFFKIIFAIKEVTMTIRIECAQKFPEVNFDEEMGLLMIKALSDDFVIKAEETLFLSVSKSHKRMKL